MKTTFMVRALAGLCFVSLTLAAHAAEQAKAVDAFASHPAYCSQFRGSDQHAGDAVDAQYGASLSAGLAASLSGNSRDVEAALRTIAAACSGDATIHAQAGASASK